MADAEHHPPPPPKREGDLTSEEIREIIGLLDERHPTLRTAFEGALGARAAALLRLHKAEADLLSIARHLGVRDTPSTSVERVGS